MNQLFSGKEWDFVSVHLNNVLIASQSMEEHTGYINKVLLHLKETELRLKPSKCTSATDKIKYLKHTQTAQEVRPNCRKAEAMKYFLRPIIVKKVALANFYHQHILDMARIYKLLTALTRKDVQGRM